MHGARAETHGRASLMKKVHSAQNCAEVYQPQPLKEGAIGSKLSAVFNPEGVTGL